MILTHPGPILIYAEVFLIWFRFCGDMQKKTCGVLDTAESDSAVLLTPRSQAPVWYLHCAVRLCGIIDTVELARCH